MSRWKYYNPNPAGRAVGDCAVRAISAALEVDWDTAYEMLADAGMRVSDMPSSNSVIGAVLRQHGFDRVAIPNDCPDCYTAEDFARENPEGTFVVGFTGHIVCIRDGWILDAWDSSQEIPVYVWFRRY